MSLFPLLPEEALEAFMDTVPPQCGKGKKKSNPGGRNKRGLK